MVRKFQIGKVGGGHKWKRNEKIFATECHATEFDLTILGCSSCSYLNTAVYDFESRVKRGREWGGGGLWC